MDEEERRDQEERGVAERRGGIVGEGGPSATLGRRRSRIPQPRHQGGGRLGRGEGKDIKVARECNAVQSSLLR